MSARFSVVLQDNEGAAMIGQDVDLYAGASPTIPGAHTDMTDNSDGSYYCAVGASGIYTVVVGGTIHDEMQGIYIPVDDGATFQDLADHENADGAGGDDTPATNKVHNAAAIELKDSAGRFSAADVEAGLAELAGSGRTTQTVKGNADDIDTLETAMTAVKGTGWVDENLVDVYNNIGNMSFVTSPWLKTLSSPDVCDCLRELDMRVWSNYQSIINAGGGITNEISIFFDTNDIGIPSSAKEIYKIRFDRAMIVDRLQFFRLGTHMLDNDADFYVNVSSTGAIEYVSPKMYSLTEEFYSDSGPGLSINVPSSYYMGIAMKGGTGETKRIYGNITITLRQA